jgi:hypothetical protein
MKRLSFGILQLDFKSSRSRLTETLAKSTVQPSGNTFGLPRRMEPP